MGAIKMRVQRADKNITIIDSSLSINVLWSEKLSVYYKQIHQDIINFKPLLLVKYLWVHYTHDIAFSNEQIISPESGERNNQNSSKQICWWILMKEDYRGWTFSLEEELL